MPLPNQVDWHPTAVALTTALGTATDDDAAIATKLLHGPTGVQTMGTVYDARYTGAVEVEKATGLAVHAAELAAWAAAMPAPTAQADRAARYAEGLQVAAQTGLVPQPFVYQGAVLAPTTPIVWTFPDEPAVVASLTLSGDLLVTAGPAYFGSPGNAIAVTVANATDGNGAHFKLTVALGSYAETFDNIDPTRAPSLSSLLVAAPVYLTGTRPANAGPTALAGGTGFAFAAIAMRLDRAAKLPAATPELPFLAQHRAGILAAAEAHPQYVPSYGFSALALFDVPEGPWLQIIPARPTSPPVTLPNGSLYYFESSPSLFLLFPAFEQGLLASIASATAWLAQFNGPP